MFRLLQVRARKYIGAALFCLFITLIFIYDPPEDIKHLKTCLINQINCIDILTQPPTSAIADTIAFPLEKKPLGFHLSMP